MNMKERTIPEAFLSRMENVLGEESFAFFESLMQDPCQGLRANTWKIRPQTLEAALPYTLRPVPWTESGFYIDAGERPARHPYYLCGLYYLQEPSAMLPAGLLEIKPGERVLDLCAAPGGKATALGEQLKGEGVLVANDSNTARARALLRNLELFGISNAFVTNETPGRLAEVFPSYFDKILVDAPCAGEGMFRRRQEVADAWEADKPARCATMQRQILKEALPMLAPGGRLLYSTCSFSAEENEQVVDWLLTEDPSLTLVTIPDYPSVDRGVPAWGGGNAALTDTVRIWPHHARGEGHFAALFQKAGRTSPRPKSVRRPRIGRQEWPLLQTFFADYERDLPWERVEVRGGRAYLIPDFGTRVSGLHFLRSGLYLGDLKKNRLEPSQPLALTPLPGAYAACIHLPADDPRIREYLRGAPIRVEAGECERDKGWQLLCVDAYPIGWGHLVNGVLKNKYPAGWRQS